MHDVVNKRLPGNSFHDFYTPISHGHNTRKNYINDLCVPKIRHMAGQFTVKYAGAKLWNSIPPNIRNITNRKHFKQDYKRYLLTENI